MRMQRCPIGHFYDADNFQECPHCERLKAEGNWRNAVNDDSSSTNGVDQEVEKTPSFQPEITVSYHQNEIFETEAQIPPPDIEVQAIQTTPSFLANMDISNHTNEAVNENIESVATPIEDTSAQITENDIPVTETQVQSIEPVVQQSNTFIQTAAYAQSDTEKFSYEEDQISPEAVQSNSSSEKTFRLLQSETGKDPTVGWLIVLNGEHYGEDFRWRSDRNYIGRNEDMDIALTGEKSVSRNKHVIISFEPRKQVFFAQPGESRKLFYLNDEVVLAPVFLKRNDVLTIGEVELMFIPLCDEKFTWKKERK